MLRCFADNALSIMQTLYDESDSNRHYTGLKPDDSTVGLPSHVRKVGVEPTKTLDSKSSRYANSLLTQIKKAPQIHVRLQYLRYSYPPHALCSSDDK